MVLFFFLQKKATIAAFYLVNMTESLKIHPFTIKKQKNNQDKNCFVESNRQKYI